MKTKLILSIIGVVLVSAALVSVSAAQFVGTQNTTTNLTQAVPPCADSTGVVPPCIATTGEPYSINKDTGAGYCGSGGCNGYGYGTQAQTQNQNQHGWGMMGQTSNGFGCR